MVNLIDRMVSMEIVWRQCGVFMMKLSWRLSGVFMEKMW